MIYFSQIRKLEMINCQPAILSRDTGQRIPCFDSCQLTNIKRVPMVMVLLSYFLFLEVFGLAFGLQSRDNQNVRDRWVTKFCKAWVPLQRLRCTGGPLLC